MILIELQKPTYHPQQSTEHFRGDAGCFVALVRGGPDSGVIG